MPTDKTVEIRHDGGMLFHAEASSGQVVAFDDRKSGQGGSPVETVLSALGACTAMDVISIATKKRQAIESYTIHVTGSQRDEYPQIFTEITVTHEVVGVELSVAAIRRSIELSAMKYCPVSAMISAGATVVHHRYKIASTGANPFEAEGEVVATGPYTRPEIQRQR
ncbi:MAG: OsmC family peroxiredoxin [Thermomicrobiales bacterium]|nr:MAG: OsmC family peroxiredoxin [Thermomicrobiales bacterium]